MDLSKMTRETIFTATAAVRRELRNCENASVRGNQMEAYSAAERAQEAAFNLKLMFAPKVVEEATPEPTGADVYFKERAERNPEYQEALDSARAEMAEPPGANNPEVQ